MLKVPGSYAATHWTAAQVAAIDAAPLPEIPVVTAHDVMPIVAGLDVWDAWPITDADGRIFIVDGTELWMMLSAPVAPDPAKRHDAARIRLIERRGTLWHDCGNLLPDALNPGSREWAGSAIIDPATNQVALYFTASGRRGERLSFEQRQFWTVGTLTRHNGQSAIADWSVPRELFVSDGDVYVDTRTTQGGPGMIKGFRDPFFVRDPADGAEYLTFVGSDGRSSQVHNGVVGIARRDGDAWTVLPPVLSADGLCNEMERPHVIVRGGRYYLFWSTQRHVFAPGGPSGPNGLYGAVAEAILGPYRMLNGTGLVAANPASEPFQTYSWLVLDTLQVTSFIDYWGMHGRTVASHPETTRAQFGGTPAPFFALELDGDRAHLAR
jgi:levansucrase